MTRKPGSMYREIRGQAYARKEYMGGVPQIRISQFDIGDPRTKFPVKIHLVAAEACQIRHIALEAARISANRYIAKKAGNAYHLKLRLYPHNVLRENKIATGAGADRISEGMRAAFGAPVGTAARGKPGMKVFDLDDRGPRRRRERGPTEGWREVADALAARDRTGEERSIDERGAETRSPRSSRSDNAQLFLAAGFWRSDDERDQPPARRHSRAQRKDGRSAVPRWLADNGRGPRAGNRNEGRRRVPRLRGSFVRSVRRRRDARRSHRPPGPRPDAPPPVQPRLFLRPPRRSAGIDRFRRRGGADAPEESRPPDDDAVPPLASRHPAAPGEERSCRSDRRTRPAGGLRRSTPRLRLPYGDGRGKGRRRLPLHRHGRLPPAWCRDPHRQAGDYRGPRTRDREGSEGSSRPRAPTATCGDRPCPRCPRLRDHRLDG